MALTKRNEYKIEVLESGALQIRRSDIINEDGVDIATSYFRYIINPGDNFSNEPARVQAVANAVHTAEVISAYSAAVAAGEE